MGRLKRVQITGHTYQTDLTYGNWELIKIEDLLSQNIDCIGFLGTKNWWNNEYYFRYDKVLKIYYYYIRHNRLLLNINNINKITLENIPKWCSYAYIERK